MEISERTHGIFDLIFSASYLFAPLLLREKAKNEKNINNTILPILGTVILTESLLTISPFGIFKVLPMADHIKIDYGLGALMLAGPLLFNIDKRAKLPMAFSGLAGIAIAVLTERGLRNADENHHIRSAVNNALAVSEEIA